MGDPLDIGAPVGLDAPHRALRAMRERGPVLWSEAHRAWLLLRHDEVVRGFLDARLSADRTPVFEKLAAESEAFRPAAELLRGWMIFRDPPAHDALRDPVRRVFTPRQVEALAPAVARIADALLDEVEARGSCDLREVYARPLPALVIAELLGVPASDRELFQGWSDALARLVFSVERSSVDEGAAHAAARFQAYFRELIAHYEKHPAENLVSRMIEARRSGGGLDEADLAGACTLLLFAGHETTTGLIANGVGLLFAHPEALAALRRDPGLDATAPDELLRMEGPASTMVRRVAEPHERAGAQLAVGDRVFLVMAAANRDPAVFPDPDRIDLARHPNPHLGFGWGLHRCLGAPLALLETRIALRRLLDRFPRLEPAGPLDAWGGSVLGRALARVPVRV